MKFSYFRNFFFVSVFEILLFYVAVSSSREPRLFLKWATVVFRHGERNPVRSYPGDPFNATDWPGGLGALTKKGKDQAIQLGHYLRQRYPQVSETNVFIVSSDRNRTITTANLVMDGFFGPEGRKPQLKVVRMEDDDYIFISQPCPRYDVVRQAYVNNTKRPILFGGWEKEVEILEKNTGMNFTTFDYHLFLLADTLIIEKNRKTKLPAWIDGLSFQALLGIRSQFYTIITPTPELRKLLGGAMVHRLLENMDQVVADRIGVVDSSLNLISGHDTTIAVWFKNFGINAKIDVPYSSAIFMELYEGVEVNGNREYYFKLFFRNRTDKDPIQVSIPGCPDPCPYTKLRSLLLPFALKDRGLECSSTTHENPSIHERSEPSVSSAHHEPSHVNILGVIIIFMSCTMPLNF